MLTGAEGGRIGPVEAKHGAWCGLGQVEAATESDQYLRDGPLSSGVRNMTAGKEGEASLLSMVISAYNEE